MSLWVQVLGWLGMIMIVYAHFLVSEKEVTGTSHKYQYLNMIGSACIAVNVFYAHAWPAVALQLIWIAIAIYDLFKYKK